MAHKKQGGQRHVMSIVLSEESYKWLHLQKNMSLCVDHLIKTLMCSRNGEPADEDVDEPVNWPCQYRSEQKCHPGEYSECTDEGDKCEIAAAWLRQFEEASRA